MRVNDGKLATKSIFGKKIAASFPPTGVLGSRQRARDKNLYRAFTVWQ